MLYFPYKIFETRCSGNEYISIVEFAPNQKIPSQKEPKRRDPKINTIEQDPDYLKFLEMLENKSEVKGIIIGCQTSDFHKLTSRRLGILWSKLWRRSSTGRESPELGGVWRIRSRRSYSSLRTKRKKR